MALKNNLEVLIRDFWSNFFSIVGSALIGIYGVLVSMDQVGFWQLFQGQQGVLFGTGILLAIIGQVAQVLSTPGNRSLKMELKKAIDYCEATKKGYLNIVNDELYVLFGILGYGNEERISLYIHDENGANLIMIGRYSQNDKLKQKGRGFYSASQGVVGRAWNAGEAHVSDLPESTEQDDFEYVRKCVLDWNMDRQEAINLSMKSRSISAFTIQDDRQRNIALIVFESMQEMFFEEDILRALMSSGEGKRIALLLEKVKPVIPSLDTAIQRGF